MVNAIAAGMIEILDDEQLARETRHADIAFTKPFP